MRSVEELLKKDLGQARLNCQGMQNVLFEIEMIINNRPLIFIHPTNLQACLTSNHLLFGRMLNYISDHNTSNKNKTMQKTKTNKIIESITSQKLGSRDLRQIANTVLNKGKSAIPPLFNSQRCCLLHLIKQNCLLKTFQFSLLELI